MKIGFFGASTAAGKRLATAGNAPRDWGKPLRKLASQRMPLKSGHAIINHIKIDFTINNQMQ
jgi:hypothetical protein